MNSVQIAPDSPRAPQPAPTHTAVSPIGGLARWGGVVARHPWRVVVGFLVTLALAGVFGAGLFPNLQAAGYDDPNSESLKAGDFLEEEFGLYAPPVAMAVDPPGDLDSADAKQAISELESELADLDLVTKVVSYWNTGAPALASSDGTLGQVLVYADDTTPEEQMELSKEVSQLVADQGLDASVGGFGAVSESITTNVETDLAKAESIAIPLTMILLVIVFGSVVSAMLPFSVAAGGIVGSFFVLWLVTGFDDVSIFAMNLITGLGLGLGIDYALLVVNRFREELARGLTPDQAVIKTMSTAGRTVLVSGLTVALVLSSLLVFPLYFLRSFGYSGIAVTVLAVLSTLTILPALLKILGHRVDKLKVRRGDLSPKDEGIWSRVARTVMRFPVPVLLVTSIALGALAAPFFSVEFTQTDARVLPADDPAAKATQVLADDFDGQEATPIDIALPGTPSGPEVESYAQELSNQSDIVRVTSPEAVYVEGQRIADNPTPADFVSGDNTRISAISSREPLGASGRDQIEDLRAVSTPNDTVLIGGSSAAFADAQAAIVDQGRLALAWVAIATLVVLFLFTGSVLLPLKAVALNVLSLAATMGLLVLVFQEGHLTWLTGDFTVTGGIDTSMAVLIAIVTFALSMDYEVFLLSRIKEEHDAGRSNEAAVVFGLQRSGRIITAAALLLAVVFAAFVSSGVTSIKQLGLGIAFAILLDATVVRGLLVPALMRLFGEWNWWAPRPLRALHARFGLSEG